MLRAHRRWVFACHLAALVLLPTLAAAQSRSSPTSFEVRSVAAEASDETRGVPGGSGTGGRPSSKDAITTEPPPSRGLDPRARYRILIQTEAARTNLPPEVAEAVMAVESGYNPAAIGGVGEIGLMQILPSTARMLGFVGTNADLAAPETNIRYGVTYLAQAWRLAGGDLCTAVMKYRAGHGESRFSYRSVDYCVAVRAKLAARGFRVVGSVPVATFGEPGSGCGRKCLGGSGVGRVNLASLNMQLNALVMQARARR